jgi:hypothetical protein
MTFGFDPATEQARFVSRQAFLARQAALRLDLAEGLTFQPETAESVEDQILETLWAEGKTPDTVDAEELAEARASFAVLAPRREAGGQSLAATLFLGFRTRSGRPGWPPSSAFPTSFAWSCRMAASWPPPWTAAPPGPRIACPRCWPCAT